jgi:hypothetical protein
MKGIQWWAVAAAALLCWVQPVWAQSEKKEAGAGDGPQILTSDLARQTTVTETRMTVDFVIVDTDKVTEVVINGEKQKIQPSETVLVRKEFEFTEPATRIEVTATDEKGNVRTVAYVVLLPGAAMAAPKARLRVFDQVGVRYEVDTNPSNDLSTPIDLGVTVTGVVPDSQQQDTRTTVKAMAGLGYGKWMAFVGAVQQTYGKSDNDQFNSTVMYLGGAVRSSPAGENAFVAQAVFTDINLGSFDYAQYVTLTPGYEKDSKDSSGTTRSLYAVDVISKNFASSDQKDAINGTLKWDYNSTDPEGEDSFRNVIQLGNSTEGFVQSEYSFIGIDEDWINIWGAGRGFRFDVGWGLQYRSYPNDDPLTKDTPLGNTRVDIPLRFSIGPGWQFTPAWSAVLGYRYLTNLSNKQPYVREIYGLIVEGAF